MLQHPLASFYLGVSWDSLVTNSLRGKRKEERRAGDEASHGTISHGTINSSIPNPRSGGEPTISWIMYIHSLRGKLHNK